MQQFDVGGVALHYVCDGSGDPLLVLHGGLGVDHQLYRRTLAPLGTDFRLIFPDLRGNGRSVPADLASVTMEQLADDAAALLDHRELDRATVLGHSYGGFVAQELALRHPDRVRALILVDTTAGQLGDAEEPKTGGAELPPEAAELMASLPRTDDELAASMAQLLPVYFYRPDLVDLESAMRGTLFRADVMVRGFEVLMGWSSADRLENITAPTLVVAGRHDAFTSFPQAHRIAERIPGSTCAIFERSGHFPWMEEPDLFWTTLREWHSALA